MDVLRQFSIQSNRSSPIMCMTSYCPMDNHHTAGQAFLRSFSAIWFESLTCVSKKQILRWVFMMNLSTKVHNECDTLGSKKVLHTLQKKLFDDSGQLQNSTSQSSISKANFQYRLFTLLSDKLVTDTGVLSRICQTWCRSLTMSDENASG